MSCLKNKIFHFSLALGFFGLGVFSGLFSFELAGMVISKLEDTGSASSSLKVSELPKFKLSDKEYDDILGNPFKLERSNSPSYHESFPLAGMGGGYEFSSLARAKSFDLSGSLKDSTGPILNSFKGASFPVPSKIKQFNAIHKIQNKISRLPIGSPVFGEISSHYGRRTSPFSSHSKDMHSGIDIVADRGTQVNASGDGEVIFAGWKGGYGRVVIIRHPSNLETLYAHLSTVFVEEGMDICRGQQIGLIGTTGRSTGPHLHYEVRDQGTPIDPDLYIELANIIRFAS